MSQVKQIKAREIIDSRGYPTIEGYLLLDSGQAITTSIPSGTSIGKHEARELRDDDPGRFDGMGVSKAISYINHDIAPKLIGVSPLKIQEIDEWLIKADGTKNKSKLGANTILTISQLMVKAGAAVNKVPLHAYVNSLFTTRFKANLPVTRIPTPIFNILNGGAHAGHNLDFQEFQVVPSSSLSFANSYEMGVNIFHQLKQVLKDRNSATTVGEEGGFAPILNTNADALDIIVDAILRRDYKPGLDVFLGLDIAASNFFHGSGYLIKDKSGMMKREDYYKFILDLVGKYAILTLEDPLAEDEFDYWTKLELSLSKEIYLIGDDLIVTNKERLERAIKNRSCSTFIVKPNQIGSISETLEIIDMARKNDMNYVVSHRSGETNDSFIADFAVGVQADFVKFGAPSRGERVAKYNRLLQIEEEELQKTQNE